MLTISKPLSSSQAQTYHAKEFTSAEQNYWKQGDTILGEWQGRLAEQYGLAGASTRSTSLASVRGRIPSPASSWFGTVTARSTRPPTEPQ